MNYKSLLLAVIGLHPRKKSSYTLRAFTVFAEDVSSFPALTVGRSQKPPAPRDLMSSSGLCGLLHSCTHTPHIDTPIHILKNIATVKKKGSHNINDKLLYCIYPQPLY